MSVRTYILYALALALLPCSACYCPLLAKAGYEQECEGNMIDSLDQKSYRLTSIIEGQTASQSITLEISRKDCSINLPDAIAHMGISSMTIEKPRSVKEGVMVITIHGPKGDPKSIECKAPLSDTDPMVFTCPAKAGKVQYLLQPQGSLPGT